MLELSPNMTYCSTVVELVAMVAYERKMRVVYVEILIQSQMI